jgi:hypothetical protein
VSRRGKKDSDFFKQPKEDKPEYEKGNFYRNNTNNFSEDYIEMVYPGFKKQSKCGVNSQKGGRHLPGDPPDFPGSGRRDRQTNFGKKKDAVRGV